MSRIRVFRTESFRLAALFATLFLGLAGALMLTVYWIVEESQTEALVSAIDADINTIQTGYRQKGLAEAVEIVQQRLDSRNPVRHHHLDAYMLLQDEAQRRIAGDLPQGTPRLGLFSIQIPAAGRRPGRKAHHAHDIAVLGKGVYLDRGIYLFVGRDTIEITATRRRILQAFAWISGLTVILATLGGVFFSVQFLRRIDAITRTCEAIVAGKFNDRIPLRGSDDELDRLSAAVNTMLDRISALFENLRQVSSDVAHDLRTPLTHLRQRLVSAYQKSVTTEDFSQAIARALDDTDELLAIFTALLRISQIESGSRLSAFARLSLTDLLNRIYEMYRPVAEDAGRVFHHNIAADVQVRGDAELLLQLFSNVIENAVRHTHAGATIAMELAVSTDGTAVVSIRDDGPGIPESEHEKVFRRFYRLSSSRTTPGHGLGLALVAAIANLHHGKLELSNNSPGLRVSLSLALA